jgi:Cys-rich repeat protein
MMVTLCLSSALLLAACGDDDGGNDDDNQGGRSGSSGDGGTAGRSPLPADTAGKPCTGDGDCGSGTCETEVQGLDGQPAPAPGGYCMGSCATNADCGAGGVCVGAGMGQGGLCYEGCTTDADCREEYLCGPITSTCRPAPPTDQLDDNTAGTECTADPDCGDGVCLTERGMGGNATPLPGGYCSGACLEDAHCGAGGVCRRPGGGAGACYASCATDADCTRDGHRCRDLGGDQLGCLPAPDPLPDGTTGQACAADADCAGVAGACATEIPAAGGGMIATPGGYCTIACEVDLDCGAGGVCVTTRGGSLCFKTCTTAADCRTDYVCGERGGGNMPSIVCTPFEPDDEADAGI